MFHRTLRVPLLLTLVALLSGCGTVVLSPSGDVAQQQRDLILYSTGLMLLIIVPVIALTLLFAWWFRESNTRATYSPDWHHSTQLEVVIWAAPLLIIVALGALTWISTHVLDPWRPLNRIGPYRNIPADAKPLAVEVVALDWKWLFIYPEQGFAVLNELAAPVDVPINFRITSSSVMNSFFIPALAGQIYAMPGMETKLHAVINRPGEFDGFSANYSGSGFSDMHFRFFGLSNADFGGWVQKVKASGGGTLGRQEYLELEKPSIADPVKYFPSVAPNLFTAVLNRCVDRSKMCLSDMMRIDAQGGLGMAGIRNVASLEYDKTMRRGGSPAPKRYVAAICTTADSSGMKAMPIMARSSASEAQALLDN